MVLAFSKYDGFPSIYIYMVMSSGFFFFFNENLKEHQKGP